MRAQEVGGVELARRGIAAGAALQIGGMVRREFSSHQRGGVGIQLERHHGLARIAATDTIAAVRSARYQIRIRSIAVFGAVLLQCGQPGLIDELEQSGRR